MRDRSTKHLIAALPLALLCASGAVAKPSLAEKKVIAEADQAFQEALSWTNEVCGTKVKASIAWDTFLGTEAFNGRWSVSGHCEPALSALRTQCDLDAHGKKAAKRVTKVTCRYAARDKRAIALQKGELVFSAELGRANADDYVKAFLLDELDLKVTRRKVYEDEQLAKELERTNKTCGTKLDYSIDWPSFQKAKFLKTNYSVHGYCSSFLDGVRSVCGDPDGKQAISEGMRSARCTFAGKGKRSLSLKKKAATFGVDWEAANNGDFVKEWLFENL